MVSTGSHVVLVLTFLPKFSLRNAKTGSSKSDG